MGYRGKLAEREQARELRATGRTLFEIARELGVSKSSVSLWVRDVDFTPRPRQRAVIRRAHPQHLAKLAEIEAMDARGRRRIGRLSDDAFLAAGVALYAGEGSKGDGRIRFANTDATMVRFFCAWFRRYFLVDESRLRASGRRSTNTDASTSTTAVRAPIARSWVSSERCYRRRPFRGSSIGRALGC